MKPGAQLLDLGYLAYLLKKFELYMKCLLSLIVLKLMQKSNLNPNPLLQI